MPVNLLNLKINNLKIMRQWRQKNSGKNFLHYDSFKILAKQA